MSKLKRQKIRFTDRKRKVVAYVAVLAVLALFFVSFLIYKNKLLSTDSVVKQGTAFCRLVTALFGGMRGLIVDDVRAVQLADGRVRVTWKAVQGKVALYQIFRSTTPLFSHSDLEKNAFKLGSVSTGKSVFYDLPRREGRYYYAVVVRNKYGFYPVVPDRNSLRRSVAVAYKGIVHKLRADVVLEESAEGTVVKVSWQPPSVPVEGYRIYRSQRIIYNKDRLKTAKLVAVVPGNRVFYRDMVRADGHFYYAVFPIGGKQLFVAGANFLAAPFTIGMVEAKKEILPLPGVRISGWGSAGKNLQDMASELRFKDRLRSRLRGLMESVYTRYSENIVEITLFYGNELFYSTDPGKWRLQGKQARNYSGAYIARLYSRRLIDAKIVETAQGGRAIRFISTLTAEANRAFVLELTMRVPAAKSAFGFILLLIVFAFFSAVLFNLFVRYVLKFHTAFALFFIFVFLLSGLFFLDDDLITRTDRSLVKVQNFFSYILKTARESGAYREYGSAGWQRVAQQLLIDRNGGKVYPFYYKKRGQNQSITPTTPIVVSNAWHSSTTLFLLFVLLIIYFSLAVPLYFWASRGGVERLLFRLRSHRVAWLFVAPSLLLFFFVFVPVAMMGAASLSNLPPLFEAFEFDFEQKFIGLRNYLGILFGGSVGGFWAVLRNTVFYTVAVVALQLLLGVSAAVLLHVCRAKRYLNKIRPFFILPWALPSYVGALTFSMIFDPGHGGVVNQLLSVVGLQSVDWLHSVSAAIFVMTIATVWFGFPFIMVVALGALESVPSATYEAAKIDGATVWQRLYLIALPAVRPAVVQAAALSAAWTFNNLNYVYMINKGWDGSDMLVSRLFDLLLAKESMVGYGYVAAFSVLTMAIVWLYIRSLRFIGNVDFDKYRKNRGLGGAS